MRKTTASKGQPHRDVARRDRARTGRSAFGFRTTVPPDDLGEIAVTTGDDLIDAFLRVQAIDAGRGR